MIISKQTHPNKKTINAFLRFDNIESAKTAAKEMLVFFNNVIEIIDQILFDYII